MNNKKSLFLFLFINLLGSITYCQTTSSGWVTTIKGSGFETLSDVSTDSNGNVYAIGVFNGNTTFNGLSNSISKSAKGETDAYVSKFDADGELIWVSTFGGPAAEFCFGISIDQDGHVFVVGTFEESADFDPSDDDFSLNSSGREDIFIVQLDESGNLVWAKSIGGSSVDEANDIALDEQGNMYIVGRFVSSVDFDPGSGSEVLQAGSFPDAFILKLDQQGDFLWAHDIGSGDNEEAECVEIDNQGNIVISGTFSGTVDFDPGTNEFEMFGEGINDPFFLKLTLAGDFIWARSFRSGGFEYSGDIAIDEENNVLGHGYFRESINFNPQGAELIIESAGAEDCYTAKFSSSGQLQWVNVISDPNISFGYGVATDILGDVYVTGLYYDSPDFDPGFEEFFMPSSGIEDTYLCKYSKDGDFIWSKTTGGSSSDAGYGVDISNTGDIILGGNFWNTSDLDPELDATLNISSSGGSDAFIAKINQIVSSTNEGNIISEEYLIGPNPTNSLLNIKTPKSSIQKVTIVDSNGKVMMILKSVNGLNETINVSSFSSGVYYIIIESTAGKQIKRFVVSN